MLRLTFLPGELLERRRRTRRQIRGERRRRGQGRRHDTLRSLPLFVEDFRDRREAREPAVRDDRREEVRDPLTRADTGRDRGQGAGLGGVGHRRVEEEAPELPRVRHRPRHGREEFVGSILGRRVGQSAKQRASVSRRELPGPSCTPLTHPRQQVLRHDCRTLNYNNRVKLVEKERGSYHSARRVVKVRRRCSGGTLAGQRLLEIRSDDSSSSATGLRYSTVPSTCRPGPRRGLASHDHPAADTSPALDVQPVLDEQGASERSADGHADRSQLFRVDLPVRPHDEERWRRDLADNPPIDPRPRL